MRGHLRFLQTQLRNKDLRIVERQTKVNCCTLSLFLRRYFSTSCSFCTALPPPLSTALRSSGMASKWLFTRLCNTEKTFFGIQLTFQQPLQHRKTSFEATTVTITWQASRYAEALASTSMGIMVPCANMQRGQLSQCWTLAQPFADCPLATATTRIKVSCLSPSQQVTGSIQRSSSKSQDKADSAPKHYSTLDKKQLATHKGHA